MKKILYIALGLFVSGSILGFKKGNAIKNVADALTYKALAVHNFDFSEVLKGIIRFSVNMQISNPTDTNLDLSMIKIVGIKFFLPNNTEPFAQSTSVIENIAIPAQNNLVLNDIAVEVMTNQTLAVWQLLKQTDVNTLIESINISPIIEVLGQEITI
jgi:hypothetical protein